MYHHRFKMIEKTQIKILRCATLVFAIIACTAMTGCNILEPLTYAVEGPPQAPAVYQLPEKKIVVFVDDRSSIIPRTRLRRTLAHRTTNDLLRVQQIVPAAVEPSAAVRLAQTEDSGHLLSIAEIGRRIGADLVIYIHPIRFSLSSGGLPKPIAVLGVKIIDTRTGDRLFPIELGSTEHILTATMAAKTGSNYDTEQARKELENSLADFAGLRVAQLFYEHEPNPLDGEVSR